MEAAELNLSLLIDEAITHFSNANDKIASLVRRFDFITKALNGPNWYGEAHFEFMDIHEAIIIYEKQLNLFSSDLQKYCTDLKVQIEDFNLNSTNVEQLGNW